MKKTDDFYRELKRLAEEIKKKKKKKEGKDGNSNS